MDVSTPQPDRSGEKDIRIEMHRQLREGALLEQAVGYAREYCAGVYARNVAPIEAAVSNLESLNEPLPERSGDAASILKQLHDVGSPGTVAQNGGRFFGLVNGGVIPAALGARVLADSWDQNAALHATSPVNAKLEHVCQRWLVDLFGLPESTVAGFVAGTSSATTCGLAAARYRLLERLGWNVNSRGLDGAPRTRIVSGTHIHGTVLKAISLLGFGTERIEWVDVDAQGRLRMDALPELDDRTILILQAGNVHSGSFDPIHAACAQANEAGAWVHVDGAFGLWAAASLELRHLTDGIALAQSWSVDGHKTLNSPYDNGIVLCSDSDALVSALQNDGAYIMYSKHRDGMLYTPEMSRRARAVELWATLRYLGRRGIEELIVGLHQRALQFEEELRSEGFEILNDVVFNQVIVACESEAQTQSIIANVRSSGEAWVGGSVWLGRPVIRVSVCAWATAKEDVTRTVQAFVKARDRGQGCSVG